MIIGIAANSPQAGKTTVADILVRNAGYMKYSFADPIKDVCDLLFDWDERHREGELKEVDDVEFGISPRYAYQTLGTDWARKMINPDIWLLIAKRVYHQHKRVVIPDVRFENEATFIRNQGGIIIHLHRPEMEGKVFGVEGHPSEQGIRQLSVDYSIDNFGTLPYLELCVDKVFGDAISRQVETFSPLK